ncbi:MAG: hypothetical protein V4502_09425, partial [Pseudomonadota bacterium]
MAGERPKGWKLLRAALATRKAATMLAFGFSSGLPFALLIGTLNAWLGDREGHVLVTWKNQTRMEASKKIRRALGRTGDLPEPGLDPGLQPCVA